MELPYDGKLMLFSYLLFIFLRSSVLGCNFGDKTLHFRKIRHVCYTCVYWLDDLWPVFPQRCSRPMLPNWKVWWLYWFRLWKLMEIRWWGLLIILSPRMCERVCVCVHRPIICGERGSSARPKQKQKTKTKKTQKKHKERERKKWKKPKKKIEFEFLKSW